MTLAINDSNGRIRQRIVAAGAGAAVKAQLVPPPTTRSLRIVSAISSRCIVLVKHSVRIAGHATSVSLEAAFWQAFTEIAAKRGQSVNALLAAIDAERTGNLSSAIRLFVLEACRRGELGEPDRPQAVAHPSDRHH